MVDLIAFPLDNVEYDSAGVGLYMATRTRGVFSAEGMYEVNPSALGGLRVDVSPGLAWLKFGDSWGVSVTSEQQETLQLANASSQDRVDSVVLRAKKAENKVSLQIVSGVPGGGAVLPVRDDEYDDIVLAYISVKAGAVTLRAGDITDTRLDEDVCGLMRDGVTGIPTSQLQEQASDLIEQAQALVDVAKGVVVPTADLVLVTTDTASEVWHGSIPPANADTDAALDHTATRVKAVENAVGGMTDYIVEEFISTASRNQWSWIKYASGIAECWVRMYTAIDVSTSWQANLKIAKYNLSSALPITFLTTPMIQGAVHCTTSNALVWFASAGGASASSVGDWYLVSGDTYTGQGFEFHFRCTGRWK